jgi:two-component sensor histidine kinase
VSRLDRVSAKREWHLHCAQIDIESEPLPADRAIPLGLIVNEACNECR